VSSRKNSKRGSDVSGTHFLTTHHDDMHQLPLVRPSTIHELRNARPVTPRALFHSHTASHPVLQRPSHTPRRLLDLLTLASQKLYFLARDYSQDLQLPMPDFLRVVYHFVAEETWM
jgi:hypothetical protein